MKKSLRNQRTALQFFSILCVMLLFSNFGWGQQVIGSFPTMDGGFESQVNTLATSSIGTNTSRVGWSHGANTTTVNATGGRSGSKYITSTTTFASSGTGGHVRVQSPTTALTAIPVSTAHMIQFYYKLSGTSAATGFIRGAVSADGTVGASYGTAVSNVSNSGWIKYSGTASTKTISTYGVGVMSYYSSTATTALSYDFDDFVIYAGSTADVTAPNEPTSFAISSAAATQQTISWNQPTAKSGEAVDGVDGGGYMVVRSTADPSTPPNANGIYAVGNFVAGTEKVVYLGTNRSFIDLGLSASTQYYYRIYTVDKAFNYSTTVVSVNGTTTEPSFAAEPTTQASGITFSSISSTGMTINWTAGSGTNSLVVVKEGSAVNADPGDGNTLSPNTIFGSGAQLGTGNYVVYNSTSNSVSVTGLLKARTYYVKVYSFNGSAGTENYLVTAPVSSYQETVPGEITSAQSGPWATTTTWNGGAVPTQGDNVTISTGHTVDIATTSTKCYNLTIPATSKVWSPSGKTLQVYGTSLECNGTFGDASTANSQLTVEFGGNLTISGTGGIYPFKLRPVTGLTNIGVTFDANVSLTGTGTTLMFDNIGNDNIYYTVNSPRTLSIATNFNSASSAATQSSSNNILTINSGATVNVAGVLNTNEASGKTYTANINGTLAVTGTSSLYGLTGGGVATFNVNGNYTSTGNLSITPIEAFVAPVINVGSSGVITVAGTADFSHTTLTGYIGNTTSTFGGTFNLASGGTIKFAAASGLESVSGPIRTTTRNFSTGANYNFVGSVAQVSGSDLPATVNNLTINNAAGVTLGANTTVNGLLTLTSGIFSKGSSAITLANAATIVRTAGTLSAAPTFGSTVNVTYNGATAISSGYEIPNATSFSTVLNNLTIATTASAVVTLASATNLNNKLTVTTGSLATGGLLTLKSSECCTAYVAPVLSPEATPISGNVIAERYIPATKRAYRLLSSPVTTLSSIYNNWQEGGTDLTVNSVKYGTHITGALGNTNSFDNTTSNAASMFTHNNTTPAWTALSDTNGILSAGSPYLIYIRGSRLGTNITSTTNDATTLRGTGALTTGTVTVSGLNTNLDGFSLVGNPYQSQVDMSLVFANAGTTNLNTGFYYVVDPSIGTKGAYLTVDVTEAATAHISKYLQPWQGCFVKTATAAAASISFQESNKSDAVTQTTIFRTKNTAMPSIDLTLLDVSSNRLDVLKVAFDASETNDVNQNDASKMTNFDENMASSNSGKLLAIEKRAVAVETDEIPLNITKYKGSSYSIKAEGSGLTGSIPYLLDQFTNKTTEIPQDGSVNYAYSVDSAIPASIAADRFKITYTNKTLKTIDNVIAGFVLYPNPSKSNSFSVVLPQGLNKASLTVSNLLGQKLYSQNDLQSGATTRVNVSNVKTAGVYLVSLTSEGKTATTKWIVE